MTEIQDDVSVQDSYEAYTISHVDMDVVRDTWLSWYNKERATLGLHAYVYDSQLDATALEWSQISKSRGYMDHRREVGDAYYDYWKINDWFIARGIQAKNVYRVTHSENIGWGTYRCSDTDCTQELIDAIRSTFDFYMGEKYQEYQPHYTSMTNAYFYSIGLGIVIDESTNRYYLTVHHVTEIIE